MWNKNIVPTPKTLGKRKAKPKQPLRNARNNKTLPVIAVVNLLRQAFCKGVMVSKSLKEEFEGQC